MSLYLAPPNSVLADAVTSEGWLDDEQANMDMGYGSGLGGAEAAYQGFQQAWDDKTLYGVFRGQEPIGFVTLKQLPRVSVTQFHGFLAPQYRGTVLSARLLKAVERATLGNGTDRLETEVLCRNRRVARLLKGLGFRPEGVHKARHLMDGRRENTETYRMLKTEWKGG